MTVKRQKIQIDVEADTASAVRGLERVAASENKVKHATEGLGVGLKKVRHEYEIQQARLQNYTDKVKAFTDAENRSIAALKKKQQALKINGQAANEGASGLASLASSAARIAGPIGLGAVALGAAAVKTSEYAQESLKLQGIFNNLPFSLKAARNATRGLADDETLARNAIMAHQSGVAATADAYGELVGMAQMLALKMGRDVNDTVERVTMGIAKQEREILDELVVLPRMEDMWKKYAKQLGVTTAQLTDHQKNAAFTESALEAMRKATQGVEVDMDGAAAAIARATVEAKNLRTEILAGGLPDETVSFAEGVRGLGADMLREVDDISRYRTSFDQVGQALQRAGVDVSEYKNQQDKLEKAVRKVLDAEVRRLVTLAETGKLTADQTERLKAMIAGGIELSDYQQKVIAQSQELAEQDEKTTRIRQIAAQQLAIDAQKRLTEVQEEIAFGKSAQIDQRALNGLVQEEYDLRAKIAESKGDLDEAAKIRREAQLAMLSFLGGEAAPKKGGRSRATKQEDRSGAIRAQNEYAQQVFELNQARAQRQRDQAASMNPFDEGLAEQQLTLIQTFEERRAEIVLNQRMRAIEEQRAAGVDPVVLAQKEADAQLAFLEVQRRVTDEEFQRQIDLALLERRFSDERQLQVEREMALRENADLAKATQHAVEVARIEELTRKEQEAHERKIQIASESMDLAIGAAQAIVQASVIEGRALKGVIASTAKSEAMRHGLILGPSALVQAGFHAAVGNIPTAVKFATQAGMHFAFAASMGALGASVGAFGGGGGIGKKKVSGAFGAGDFGAGDASGGGRSPRSSSGGRGGGDMGGAVPISAGHHRDVSGMAAMSGAGKAGVTVVVQMPGLQINGRPDERTAQDLDKMAQMAGRRIGKLVAGGGR